MTFRDIYEHDKEELLHDNKYKKKMMNKTLSKILYFIDYYCSKCGSIIVVLVFEVTYPVLASFLSQGRMN